MLTVAEVSQLCVVVDYRRGFDEPGGSPMATVAKPQIKT